MLQVIKPSFELEPGQDLSNILIRIERAGRTCYKSESEYTQETALKFVKMIMKRGHLSVMDHVSISIRFIIDRGVSHEVVRHRIAAYSQESTRYCNYKDKPIQYVDPIFFPKDEKTQVISMSLVDRLSANQAFNRFDVWLRCMGYATWGYNTLIKMGAKPEEARTVLPNSLKTEILVTYDIPEWIHFLKLRTAKDAHPQMREVVQPVLEFFKENIPVIFDDI